MGYIERQRSLFTFRTHILCKFSKECALVQVVRVEVERMLDRLLLESEHLGKAQSGHDLHVEDRRKAMTWPLRKSTAATPHCNCSLRSARTVTNDGRQRGTKLWYRIHRRKNRVLTIHNSRRYALTNHVQYGPAITRYAPARACLAVRTSPAASSSVKHLRNPVFSASICEICVSF